jgi:hypothetical protein
MAASGSLGAASVMDWTPIVSSFEQTFHWPPAGTLRAALRAFSASIEQNFHML